MPQKEKLVVRSLDVGRGIVKYTTGHIEMCGRLATETFSSIATAIGEQSVAELLVQSRKLVVSVEGRNFVVGTHLSSAISDESVYIEHDAFFQSLEFIAIVRAALSKMQVPTSGIIDKLVLGLPLKACYGLLFQQIEAVVSGMHVVPTKNGTRVIYVESLKIVPRVVGGLLGIAVTSGKKDTFRRERNLTINVGFGTVEWLVSDGMKVNLFRSSSADGGVLTILRAILKSIAPEFVSNTVAIRRLDAALREDDMLLGMNKQRAVIAHGLAEMERIITSVLVELMRNIGNPADMHNIFLTGGGAHLYRRAIAKEFHDWEVSDPAANGHLLDIRGMQMLAEEDYDTSFGFFQNLRPDESKMQQVEIPFNASTFYFKHLEAMSPSNRSAVVERACIAYFSHKTLQPPM